VRRKVVIFLFATFISIFGAVSCQEINVEQPGDEEDTVVEGQPQKQDQPQQQEQPQQQQSEQQGEKKEEKQK
jgi:hypothetical protein